MFSITFWKDTLERVLVTAAEVVLGFLTADGLGILEVDWAHIGSVALVAALASLLKALIASRIGDGTASLVDVTARH